MPHKLLLADDSVTIQRVIELTFADEDITVIAVGDGRQAIERATAERPDIVLADVGMPEQDGYEVAAFIKGTPALAHIPVLLLTGAFEPIDEGRARAAKCDGVLVKPFEPQMVINRVKDLIAGRRPAGVGGGALNKPAPPDRLAAPKRAAQEFAARVDAVFPVEAQSDTRLKGTERASDRAPARNKDLAGELAGWDSEVPAGVVPALTPLAVRATNPTSATPESVAVPVPLPTLAEAFAALLTAEVNAPVAAGAVARAPVSSPTEDAVEQISRRVIERMTDAAVREIVLDVAERLVREEIERIKAG